MEKPKIQLPYRVYIKGGPFGSPTRRRDGTVERVTAMYFATKEEAVKFCGNPKLVRHRPGEAWKYA